MSSETGVSIKGVRTAEVDFKTYNIEEHRSPTGKVDTFFNSFKWETEQALMFTGPGTFNLDLQPYQPRVLRFRQPSEENRIIRELLLEDSELLQKHTYSLIYSIVKWGWEFEVNTDKRIPKEKRIKKNNFKDLYWTTNEEDVFIDTSAKAYVIDSAFMTKWGDGEFRTLTSNDVVRPYADGNRQIVEVYFRISLDAPLYFQENDKIIKYSRVGYLTQYSKEESKEIQTAFLNTRSMYNEEEAKNVYRMCVMFTPKPKIDKVYGVSVYKNLCSTALKKIYNQFYAMVILAKGGVHYDLVYPEDIDPTIKKAAAKDLKRGALRSGIGWEVNGIREGVGVNNIFQLNATEIPSLPFMDVDYLISEESKLSQQEIKGSPETGALGGTAPEVMADRDDRELEQLFNFVEQQILYVNDVFHDIPSYYFYRGEGKDDDESAPVIEKIPLYTVKFVIPKQNTDDEKNARQDAENKKKNEIIQGKSKRENKEQSEIEEHSMHTFIELDYDESNIETHSFLPGYVTYTGNMFQAGLVLYPDRPRGSNKPKSIIYSADEIKEMTEDHNNKGDIEIGHSRNPMGTRLNNIGFYEIHGFDGVSKDITKFHFKDKDHKNLIKKGYVKNGKILLSPYFIWSKLKFGKKRIRVQNVGVIHPNEKTRSEYSGLDTSAIRSY